MYLYRGLGAASIQDQITAAANSYGVPPSLAIAVAQRESGFNQAAVGTSGEKGVFQLMPGTAAQLGVDPTDLTQNIDGGVKYLSQLNSQFGGDWRLTLEAYNGGPGNVQRGTVSSAAQSYADALLPYAGAGVVSDGSDSTDTGSQDGSPVLGVNWDAALSPAVLAGMGIAVLGIAFLWRGR